MSKTATVVLISLAATLAGCSSLGTAHLRSNGKLAPCDSGPHCVSSQSADPARHVEAISYTGARSGAQQLMAKIIGLSEGAKIVEQQDGYIHATYTSPLVSFVDDLELQFSGQKFIDVRSSSRIGYYDFGANRNRVEALRKTFNERQP